MKMRPETITIGSSGQRRRTYPTLLTKPRSSELVGDCDAAAVFAASVAIG